MSISLRRIVSLVILALVILVGLFSWTAKVASAPAFHSSSHLHELAYVCPPPPFNCQG
jgi:hypothetical protein